MSGYLALLAVILWVIANRFNVSTNGDHDWDCAAAIAILIPLTILLFGRTSWTYCLLLAVLLFPTNWLYFKISGHTDGIVAFLVLAFIGVFVCLLAPSLGASLILDKF
jgi:hypothetical protein